MDAYDRAVTKRYTDDYRAKNPEKVRAWAAVRKAVDSGRLRKPDRCPRCKRARAELGRTGIQAHHPFDDYSRPLRIVWLCRRCHNNVEAEEARHVRIHGAPADDEVGGLWFYTSVEPPPPSHRPPRSPATVTAQTGRPWWSARAHAGR